MLALYCIQCMFDYYLISQTVLPLVTKEQDLKGDVLLCFIRDYCISVISLLLCSLLNEL